MQRVLWAFFTLAFAGYSCAFAENPEAKESAPQSQAIGDSTPWDKMDYGPFFSGLYNAKNITIRIGTNQAALSFDTELLRMSSGWTGGFIKLPTARNGFEGQPVPAGKWAFSTLTTPGWANKDGNFDDPRPLYGKQQYGSLPSAWGHFKGLYVNGEKVILSYSIGSSSVLEMPGFQLVDGVPIFTRSFHIDASPRPMTLLLCEHLDAEGTNIRDLPAVLNEPHDYNSNSPVTIAEVQGNLKSSHWEVDQAIRLHVPASSVPFDFTVLLSSGSMSNALRFAQIVTNQFPQPDIPALCKGGATQWPEVVTHGKRAEDRDAYVVDALTLPSENPWHSWIRPSGFDFFSDGRMALCSVSGDVWIVSGIDEQLEKLRWKRFATGLFQPLGLKIVRDEVYVLGRDQITRLHDLNGDGEADYYENFNSDVPNGRFYHEFCFDLQTDDAGNFYFAKGSNLRGTPAVPYQGTLLKLSSDGKRLDVVANGFRAPNGLAIGPQGQITISDNEGEWIPASRLNWVKPGGFYGFVPTAYTNDFANKQEPPIFFLPKSADNSSGGQVWVTSDKWGPLKGHLLHTSYGTCSLFNVMMENVGGDYQGGAVRLPLTFDSGVMRARFSPRDGQLYLCGTGGWQTRATKDGGFYRVRYTGKPVRLPNELHVTRNAINITFTCALDKESATDPQNYFIEQWNYLWSIEYGSREYSVSEPKGARTHDSVQIKSVSLSEDRKTVTIDTDRLVQVNQMRISFNINAADGVPLKDQIYNTINHLP